MTLSRRVTPPMIRSRLRPPLGGLDSQYPPRPLRAGRGVGSRGPAEGPLVSIIMPSLNSGRFIEAALSSVLTQSYPSIEVIIVDSGSEDETAAVLARFNDPRVKVITRPSEVRQAAAINLGFEVAKGEVFAWLCCDDLLLPGAIESAVAALARGERSADLVYGYRILINAEGEDIGLWTPPTHDDASLIWFDLIPQETVFWRADWWRAVGGLDDTLELAFDWDFLLSMHRAGARFERIARFMGAFRQHPGQKTRRLSSRAHREVAEIRNRWHGRPVTAEEAQAAVRPVRLASQPAYLNARLRHAVGFAQIDADPPVINSNGSATLSCQSGAGGAVRSYHEKGQ